MSDIFSQHISKFSVAPMMDWTDRHCRYFHRLINPYVTLYTEMVTTGALLHGDTDRFLRFNEAEQPVILQLGGSDPQDLARCAKLAQDYGYDGINLNCGCPSPRVQKGAFGACLMAEPELVADCYRAMRDACSLPIGIKCRIGIDQSDEFQFLEDFIKPIKDAGCTLFIIHARKAWLNGLSPKDNREIPPLDYERVYQLKSDHPDLEIHINGGIRDIKDMTTHMKHVDGVMIGREAYQNPWILHQINNEFSSANVPALSEMDVVRDMMIYAEREINNSQIKLHDITRHMHGLFQGQRGAKAWRQHLSKVSKDSGNNPDFIRYFLGILGN